jgi:WD40 repeat protein
LLFQSRKRLIEAVAFHPGNRLLAVAGGSDDPVELFDASTGAVVWTGPVLSYLLTDNLRFDRTGRRLFAAGGEEGLFVIDTGSGESERFGRFDVPDALAVSPNGRHLVVSDSLTNKVSAFPVTANGVGSTQWEQSLRGHTVAENWRVGGIDFYPDSKRFASLEFCGRTRSGFKTWLRVRSAKDGEILDKTAPSCEGGSLLKVSPDGEWTAFASSSHLFAFHATEHGDSVKLASPNRKHITGLAFHPSGRFLAVTSNDATVRLYDVQNRWEIARTFEWKIGKLKSVAFSADGTLAAAGGEKGQVIVWDVDV